MIELFDIHLTLAEALPNPRNSIFGQVALSEMNAHVLPLMKMVQGVESLEVSIAWLPLKRDHDFFAKRPAADAANLTTEFGND
jgi:hypothetical protein